MKPRDDTSQTPISGVAIVVTLTIVHRDGGVDDGVLSGRDEAKVWKGIKGASRVEGRGIDVVVEVIH